MLRTDSVYVLFDDEVKVSRKFKLVPSCKNLQEFIGICVICRVLNPKMTDSKNDKTKVDLGLLEEDDEFEEFPAEDWTAVDEDNEDISVWEDNWDDDDVEDDFNQQLRAQLEKQKAQSDTGKEN